MSIENFALPHGRGLSRNESLGAFAVQILQINNAMDVTMHWTPTDTSKHKDKDFMLIDNLVWVVTGNPDGLKWSSRGWCYLLEPYGLRKGDFDKAQQAINECRKRGYLPIDFVAQDDKRSFANVEMPDEMSPLDFFKRMLKSTVNAADYYTPDWWKGETYYVQMLVEKIDLRSLFRKICAAYHIPIANTGGWYDILERAQIAERFKWAEARGLKPVLLYCGDLDPWGRAISDFLRSNFEDIRDGTKWSPRFLEIDRFGLEPDFIDRHHLTWIENLESGGRKDMSLMDNRIVTKYIEEMEQRYGKGHGVRKCEANAIAVASGAGMRLCRDTIEKWYGKEVLHRFAAKHSKIQRQITSFKKQTGFNTVAKRILHAKKQRDFKATRKGP